MHWVSRQVTGQQSHFRDAAVRRWPQVICTMACMIVQRATSKVEFLSTTADRSHKFPSLVSFSDNESLVSSILVRPYLLPGLIRMVYRSMPHCGCFAAPSSEVIFKGGKQLSAILTATLEHSRCVSTKCRFELSNSVPGPRQDNENSRK